MSIFSKSKKLRGDGGGVHNTKINLGVEGRNKGLLVAAVVFAVCGLAGFAAGQIFKNNSKQTLAASANIAIEDNDQRVTVDQSTQTVTIRRESKVTVTDPESYDGYVLTARIAQNQLGDTSTVDIFPKTDPTGGDVSPCTETVPCRLSSETESDIRLNEEATATLATGHVTEWVVVITVPAETALGSYIVDIEYTETSNSLPCNSYSGNTSCIVDMDSNMVPITYTGDTTVAEWSKANNSNWYDYDNHQWANAVTLDNVTNKYDCGGGADTCTALAYYKQAAAGTEILEEDVIGYWVYIPRYAYQVQRSDIQNSAITTQTPWKVKFQKATDTKLVAKEDPNLVPKEEWTDPNTPPDIGSYIAHVAPADRWHTHPGFTYGDTELNGLWMGKYETGDAWGYCTHDGNTNCGSSNIGNERTYMSDGVTARAVVKPDISPMTMQRVAYQFQTAQGMVNSHNLDAGQTRTSVTKDIEWTTAAYLSNSRMGIYDVFGVAYYADSFTSKPSVNKVWNNGLCNEDGILPGSYQCYGTLTTASPSGQTTLTRTGYGPAVCAPAQAGCSVADANATDPSKATDGFTNAEADPNSAYYTLRGMLASTTHNVYGVYDMAGGVWEYQMTAYTDLEGNPYTGNGGNSNSGFLFDGEARCSASACSNTLPSIDVTGTGSPWYYTPPTGGTTLETSATSKYFTFYDQRHFTNNHPQTNYNQCTAHSCLATATMEVMRMRIVANGAAGWDRAYSYFTIAGYPWSIRSNFISNAQYSGIWAMNRDTGRGVYYTSYRTLQSRI